MPLTYRSAGVDIDAGNALVKRIAPLARATRRPGVLEGIGGFGGLFGLKEAGFKDPVLVSGTDGVGTKLKIAIELGIHDTVGIDLVAMCVNDVLTCGATPLFFLDYFATGALDVDVAEAVVAGIAAGCRQADCALLGGETAELPGMLAAGEYDIAGFCVAAVERDQLLSQGDVRAGDVLIGLHSSGLHSNGFSLARKALFETLDLQMDTLVGGTPLGEVLLAPTRIYVKPVLACLDEQRDAIRGAAHITGGGLVENVPRILPDGLAATFDETTWQRPEIFGLIESAGVPAEEMWRTFNLGIGFVLVTRPSDADAVLNALRRAGEHPVVIGSVVEDR